MKVREAMTTAGTGVLGLEAQDLTVMLRGRVVLSGVTLKLDPGEWLSIVGPNGAGKTTLLRAMAGLLAPVAGRIHLEGKPLGAWSSWERGQRVSYLSQTGPFPDELSGLEVVRLGRTPYLGLLGREGPQDRQAIHWALEITDTLSLAQRIISTLSGGERQRILLARALAARPRFLLLDEPTLHLDIHHQGELLQILSHLRKEGIGIASVLHDLNLASRSDTVALLAQGKLRAQGSPGQVIRQDILAEVYGPGIEVLSLPSGPVVLLGD